MNSKRDRVELSIERVYGGTFVTVFIVSKFCTKFNSRQKFGADFRVITKLTSCVQNSVEVVKWIQFW